MSIPPTSFLKYDISDPACYPGSGTVITDLEANLDGTITSAGLFVSDGQQSYINITSGSQRLQSNAYNFPVRNVYSFSSIFKTSGQLDYNTCISLAEGDGSGTVPFFAVGFNSPNEFNIPSSSNGFGVGNINGNLKLQNDTWNLLTLTADGTTQKLYLNGILVGSVAHTASFNGANPRLQSGYPGSTLYAAIQKIAVLQMWETALTETQVKDLADFYRTRFSLYQPVNSYDFSVSQSYPGSGSTVFDLAGSLNLPISGATNAGTGQSKYFSFDGVNDYIGIQSGLTGLGNTFTISEWINPNSPVTFGAAFSSGTNTGSITGPTIYTGTDGGGDVIGSFNFGVGTANTSINADEWSLITFTGDGTTVKLYKDGQLVDTASQTIGTWNNGSFLMGENAGGSAQYSGKVAVLEVYNSALGSTDVANIYNSQESRFIIPPPVTATLIGSYDFSDLACWPGSGSTVFDLTAENNDLAINIISFGGTGQSKYASFNNDTSWMYKTPFSASGSTFNSNEFSISLWHNYPTQGTFGGVSYLLMGGYNAAGQGPSIVVDNADQVVKGVFGAEIVAGGWVSGIANTINTWHMTTLVGDGTNFLLYQDGALTGSTSQSGQWGGSNLVLGRPAGNPTGPAEGSFGHKFGGNIAIAEIYSGALGSTEVSNLYDLQQPRFYPPPAAPVASYDFSDTACYNGTGNTVFDLTANNNDLILTGSPSLVGTGTSKTLELLAASGQYARKLSALTGITNIPMTMNLWAKLDPVAAQADALMSYGVAANNTLPGMWSTFFNGNISFESGGVNAVINSGIAVTSTDLFYNIVASIEASTVTLYVNGTAVGTTSHSISLPGGSQFSLNGLIVSTGYDTNMEVAIAEVYNVALGSTAVTELYDSQYPRFAQGPAPPYVGIAGGRQFAQGFNG